MQNNTVRLIITLLFVLAIVAGFAISARHINLNELFENISKNLDYLFRNISKDDTIVVKNNTVIVNNGDDHVQPSKTGSLYGTITDLKKVPLEGVTVSLINDVSSYSEMTDARGKFNVSGIAAGKYDVLVQKEGYRDVTLSDFSIQGGYSYPWNLTLSRDCLYYPVNASTNYVLRYGYNGTIYRGDITYTVSYPEGSTYLVFPAADGSFSQLSTPYVAGNRVLRLKIDNSNPRYTYVSNYLYIDMKGTGTMSLFDNKMMSISDAASSQPGYDGFQMSGKARRLIDPFNDEIKALAEQIKGETNSEDTWTVAKAMFVWLKNNTEYYRGPESTAYTQSATDVLRNRRGDCDELSFLYISMLRAVGIPARFVEGYIVMKNPDEYISHVWVEFYDGEWVPVEVSDTGKTNLTNEVATRFGVGLSNHVTVFVDDGTSASIGVDNYDRGYRYNYYDELPLASSYYYYDATDYNPMYLVTCADGTRVLQKDKG
jgi:transglutaminase-like putative cysteine protease